MKLPHFILEVANVHGGVKTDVIKLINKFSKLNYENLGIKFQPFKYDMISLKDFDWYETYKELYYNEKDWSDIIELSYNNYSSVWLDLFDLYSVEILDKNIKKIHGLKFQASVLENLEIRSNSAWFLLVQVQTPKHYMRGFHQSWLLCD